MSHIATINFVQLANTCQAVFDRTEIVLQRLEDQVRQLEVAIEDNENFSAASEFVSNTKEWASRCRQKANELLYKANQMALSRGIVNATSQYTNESIDINNKIRSLETEVSREVARLNVSAKAIEGKLTEMKMQAVMRKTEEKRIGVDEAIRSISDPILRHFASVLAVDREVDNVDAIIDEAKALMRATLEETAEKELARQKETIRNELKERGIESSTIERVTEAVDSGSALDCIVSMAAQTSEAIVSEDIRRRALKTIKKAIEARGFIVPKENIRKIGDIVTMTANKLSGEKAIFKVHLDGKFIYDFSNGYRGQACEKDIEPFEKDLEAVYGTLIVNKTIDWSNPDKISTQKMQVKGSSHLKQ